mmetsp:Transcript_38751/g.96041  ORF Transcript_38751/g.96041 Transcript_38751/m.96041 type:complete len:233 (-) Transcript_38751:966-1664(-)
MSAAVPVLPRPPLPPGAEPRKGGRLWRVPKALPIGQSARLRKKPASARRAPLLAAPAAVAVAAPAEVEPAAAAALLSVPAVAAAPAPAGASAAHAPAAAAAAEAGPATAPSACSRVGGAACPSLAAFLRICAHRAPAAPAACAQRGLPVPGSAVARVAVRLPGSPSRYPSQRDSETLQLRCVPRGPCAQIPKFCACALRTLRASPQIPRAKIPVWTWRAHDVCRRPSRPSAT